MRFILIMILALSPICFGLRADLNRDGIVDIRDFAILAEEWLETEKMNLLVSGTLTPNATGLYIPYGTFGGQSVYYKNLLLDGSYPDTADYCIWYRSSHDEWWITAGTTTGSGGLWYKEGTIPVPTPATGPIGTYAVNGGTGTPIVIEYSGNYYSNWELALMQTMYADSTIAYHLGSSSSGIYNSYAPSTRDKPFVIYSQISGPRDQTFDGPSGLATIHIQLNSFAATYLEARTIADVIRRKLDGFEGTVSLTGGGSCKILETKLIDEGDVPTEQSDTIVVYGKRQDYEMVIDERP